MPELPEVETVRRSLTRLVSDKTIARVEVHWPRMVEDPDRFPHELAGKTIMSVARKGKYLLFDLDDLVLISHLRMEGKYFLKDADTPLDKHEHVKFVFTDGSALVYHDVRKFGTFCIRDKDGLHAEPPLNKLGKEPLDPTFTAAYLAGVLKGKRPLKTALLDQETIAGIGNIYADEILHCARLHPEIAAGDLWGDEPERLARCARSILQEAVALGGTSIRSYKDTLGVTGRFQQKLNVHTKDKEACPACDTRILKKKVGGRGTYFCPVCQKERKKG